MGRDRTPEWNIKLRYDLAPGHPRFRFEKVRAPDAFSAAARVLLEEKAGLPDQTMMTFVESTWHLGDYSGV